MKLLLAIVTVYAVEWIASPLVADQWAFLLASRCILVALLAAGLLHAMRAESLMLRSTVALFALLSASDAAKTIAWLYFGLSFDPSPVMALIGFFWLLNTIRRNYDAESDAFDPSHVYLLFLRPVSAFDVIKGLFGSPVGSVCIYANGYVWLFRRKTGRYEKSPCRAKLEASHRWISTGQEASPQLMAELTAILGTSRALGIKCVWVIRNALQAIGSPYAIQRWTDYIPGFYALRITSTKE